MIALIRESWVTWLWVMPGGSHKQLFTCTETDWESCHIYIFFLPVFFQSLWLFWIYFVCVITSWISLNKSFLCIPNWLRISLAAPKKTRKRRTTWHPQWHCCVFSSLCYGCKTNFKKKKERNKIAKNLPVFLAGKQLQERRTREVKKRGKERKVINLSKGEKTLWDESVKT